MAMLLLITQSSVLIYTLCSYFTQNYFICLHNLYILFLITLLSRHSQSMPTFKHYHPPDTPQTNVNVNVPDTPQTNVNVNVNVPDTPQTNVNVNVCLKCNKVKPPRYYHCRRCNICIYEMDHHCQWVGTCIGHYNYKIYIHFIIHLTFMSIICLYHIQTMQMISMYNVLRVLYGGVYGYQALRMLINIWEYVSTNQTLIQGYKGVKGQQNMSKYHKIRQMFGEQMGIGWMLPTFARGEYLDIHQGVEKVESRREQQIRELEYADEYIYADHQE